MKNKWLNIILIICMIIMQRVVIQMSGYEVYQLPFASTLFIFDNPTSNLSKLDIENPIIRINTAFKGCSSLEKISVLPRIYHN